MSTEKALIVALAAVVVGCAGRGDERAGSPDPGSSMVEIENNNWLDATVYAVNDSGRYRLGTVTTHQSRRFTLPRRAIDAGQVRFLVSLVGSSSTYMTPPIQVPPGERIEFSVENHLPLSSYMVLGSRR